MTVIEMVVYGVFSGLVGGGLASGLTFFLIERNAKIIQKKITEEANKMREKFQAVGLDNINSEFMQNEGSNKNWQ